MIHKPKGRILSSIKMEFDEHGQCFVEGRKIGAMRPIGGSRAGAVLEGWVPMPIAEVVLYCSSFVTSTLQGQIMAQASQASDMPGNVITTEGGENGEGENGGDAAGPTGRNNGNIRG